MQDQWFAQYDRQHIQLWKWNISRLKIWIFPIIPGGENEETVETWQLSNLRLGRTGEIKRTGVMLHSDPAGLES